MTGVIAVINRGVNVSIDEGLAIESAQFARLVPTRDLAEGIAAFLEKREPELIGQ